MGPAIHPCPSLPCHELRHVVVPSPGGSQRPDQGPAVSAPGALCPPVFTSHLVPPALPAHSHRAGPSGATGAPWDTHPLGSGMQLPGASRQALIPSENELLSAQTEKLIPLISPRPSGRMEIPYTYRFPLIHLSRGTEGNTQHKGLTSPGLPVGFPARILHPCSPGTPAPAATRAPCRRESRAEEQLRWSRVAGTAWCRLLLGKGLICAPAAVMPGPLRPAINQHLPTCSPAVARDRAFAPQDS